MSDAEPAAFCSYRPLPGAVLKSACPDCGHAAVLHIGVDHCPVCELVELNRQARAASVTFEQVVSGEKTINDFRAARGLPPFEAPEVVVKIEGSSLDKDALRRVVEQQLRRPGFGRA